MKKQLLFALSLLGSSTVFAVTDGITYPEAAGLSCSNVWIQSLNSGSELWKANPFESTSKARTATVVGDKVVVGFSQTMVVDDKSNDYAHIVIFDLATGALQKTVQLTCDGAPISGLLCANQIGTDDFGHVWFAGLASDPSARPIMLYYITDLDAGTCAVAGELSLWAEEEAYGGRHDYYDLSGDVTGKEARTVFISAQSSPTDPADGKIQDKCVLGWAREQGTAEWHPHFNDGEYYVGIMEETYPADQLKWNGAPTVTLLKDDGFSGDLFYVDPFVGYPTLYNSAGGLVESFASAADLQPKAGPNGVAEFTIGDVNLLAYAYSDYDNDPGCRIVVSKIGENKEFEGMEQLWVLPENAFGARGDGGTRVVSIKPIVSADANGVEGAYLFVYKCSNGMALYRVAPSDWKGNLGGVQGVEIADDNTAEAEYFNLQGVRVDAGNLSNGLYIKRQGTTVSKFVKK